LKDLEMSNEAKEGGIAVTSVELVPSAVLSWSWEMSLRDSGKGDSRYVIASTETSRHCPQRNRRKSRGLYPNQKKKECHLASRARLRNKGI